MTNKTNFYKISAYVPYDNIRRYYSSISVSENTPVSWVLSLNDFSRSILCSTEKYQRTAISRITLISDTHHETSAMFSSNQTPVRGGVTKHSLFLLEQWSSILYL